MARQDMPALNELGAAEAARLIARGRITSEALVGACLERVRVREPMVGAWAHLDPDAALAQARERDKERPQGPLHGVPVAVKDIIDAQGWPTENGSALFAGNRPDKDSEIVRRLRASGAVIMGKTVTTEFAYFNPGRTANPRGLAHTPGGSSSGSAAAVADYMAPLAFGTQTAGSVLRPAAYCGVVGFKPSFGAIPGDGVLPFAASLDTVGWMARGMADVALMRHAMTGAKPLARSRPRIGLCRTDLWGEATPPGRAAVDEAARVLKKAGASVAMLTFVEHDIVEAQKTIMAVEAVRGFGALVERHGERIGAPIRDLVAAGREVSPAAEATARHVAAQGRRTARDLFAKVDVLMTLPASGEAPLGLARTGDPLFNRAWTLLGLPCLTLPAGEGPHGLPLGVQLIGADGGDGALLAHAEWIEAALAGEIKSRAAAGRKAAPSRKPGRRAAPSRPHSAGRRAASRSAGRKR